MTPGSKSVGTLVPRRVSESREIIKVGGAVSTCRYSLLYISQSLSMATAI